MHTVLPSPSAQSGVAHLRKETEVCDSGSGHHPRGKKGTFPKPKRCMVPKRDAKWLPRLGFKSQHQSSSAAPFPAPPTIGHNCQRSRPVWNYLNYLQALLDPITNLYLGPPSWLHPVTLIQDVQSWGTHGESKQVSQGWACWEGRGFFWGRCKCF